MKFKSLLIINFLLFIAMTCFGGIRINDITSGTVTPSDSTDGPRKMLLKFDIPDSIDADFYIEHAEIVIAIEPVISDIAGWDDPPDIRISSLNADWTPGTASWGAMKFNIDRDFEIRPEVNADELGYFRWDITDLVRSWAVNGENYGIIVMPRARRDVFSIHPLRPPHVEIDFFRVSE